MVLWKHFSAGISKIEAKTQHTTGNVEGVIFIKYWSAGDNNFPDNPNHLNIFTILWKMYNSRYKIT